MANELSLEQINQLILKIKTQRVFAEKIYFIGCLQQFDSGFAFAMTFPIMRGFQMTKSINQCRHSE